MTGHAHHHALTEVPELGIRATTCIAYGTHRPTPMRFVLHHVQPQVCGGQSVAANLVSLDDACHLSVHVLLWHLAQGTAPPKRGTQVQRDLAQRGYDACVAAGTVSKIPNEGGA